MLIIFLLLDCFWALLPSDSAVGKTNTLIEEEEKKKKKKLKSKKKIQLGNKNK